MSDKNFSIEAALRFGWITTKAHLKPLLLLSVATAFLSLLLQALTRSPRTDGLSVVLALGVQVLQLLLVMVWIRVALQLHDGAPPNFERVSPLVFDFLNFLLTTVLYGLLVAVGLVLFIVPGVILAVTYGFAPFLVLDRALDPLQAFRESGRMTRGIKGHLLLFGLTLIALNLLGVIALGVGVLITLPISFLAAAYAYRRVSATSPYVPRAQPERHVPEHHVTQEA